MFSGTPYRVKSTTLQLRGKKTSERCLQKGFLHQSVIRNLTPRKRLCHNFTLSSVLIKFSGVVFLSFYFYSIITNSEVNLNLSLKKLMKLTRELQ